MDSHQAKSSDRRRPSTARPARQGSRPQMPTVIVPCSGHQGTVGVVFSADFSANRTAFPWARRSPAWQGWGLRPVLFIVTP